MENSPRLNLSYVAPQQAQKHVTVNETVRRLDALVQLSVKSRAVASEPSSPMEGDIFILPANPSGGAWGEFSKDSLAAFQDGAWTETLPGPGWRAYVEDEQALVVFDGGWSTVSGGSGGGGNVEGAPTFGVNATADTSNRLAVASPATLFTHEGAGHHLVVNKNTSADTAAVLFQTNYSGRAEMGLAGDSDFHIKVSANGSSWTDALLINKDDGKLSIGTLSNVDARVTVQGAGSGSYRGLAFANNFTDNANKGAAALVGPRKANANTPFTCVANWDNGTDRRIYVGGGGWGIPDATAIQFYTAATYNETTNQGLLRGQFHADGGFAIGSPSGGSRGAGTINAEAVYDDNSLLSCYVFDQVLDGTINQEKWDGKVPDRVIPGDVKKNDTQIIRTHEPARKFSSRIGSDYDPLTLDGYAKHWKEKRHLTSMPNETVFNPECGLTTGEWIQRLVETVEIQAVLIEELNQKVSLLRAELDSNFVS